MMTTRSKAASSALLACALGIAGTVLPASAQKPNPTHPTPKKMVLRHGAPRLSVVPSHIVAVPLNSIVRKVHINMDQLPRTRVLATLKGAKPDLKKPALIGTNTDPIVYSTLQNYSGSTTANHVDPLWLFPTTGYDAANSPTSLYVIPNTLEVKPNYSNTLTPPGGTKEPGTSVTVGGVSYTIPDDNFVAFGQTGQPLHLTDLFMAGGLENLTLNTGALAPALGEIQITIYDGAYYNVAPSDTGTAGTGGIAMTTGGNLAQYTIDFTSTTSGATGYGGFSIFEVAFPSTDYPILSNATGSFGILVAKVTDSSQASPSTAQWWWFLGYPNGANLLYINQLGGDTQPPTATSTYEGIGETTEDATGTNATSATGTVIPTVPAVATFNQSYQDAQDPYPTASTPGEQYYTTPPNDSFPLNYGLELHGQTTASAEPSVGILQGNLRLQGVDIPKTSGTQTIEHGPGSYTIALFTSGTTTEVLQQQVFAQPSFNANGTLTTNYILNGVPAGTYDILIQQTPVNYFNYESNGAYNTSLPPVFGDGGPISSYWLNANLQFDSSLFAWFAPYPYTDWFTDVISGVTVTGSTSLSAPATPTVVNDRLTRFADFTDTTGVLGSTDGVVDINDFSLFTTSYGLSTGAAGFIAACDLVGPLVQAGTYYDGVTPVYDDPPDGTVDINDFSALTIMYGTGNLESP